MSKVIMLQEEPWGPQVVVEISANTAGQQRIVLPDVAQLRSTTDQKIIWKSVRLIPGEVLANGIITGLVNAPTTELQKMTLTLYSDGWEKGQTMPLLAFNDFHFAIAANPFRFNPTNLDNWTNVDLPKSYLQLVNGTVTVGTPYCVMLQVGYVKLDKFNNEITGPTA